MAGMKPPTWPCACRRAIATSRCEAIGIPAQWLCRECADKFWDAVYARIAERVA